MKTLVALVVLLIPFPLLGDEIVLKDGRRIEWKSLEDVGETYTIVTPEGGRVVVKRSEVESFAKTEPSVPLAGATMTFDKKAKVESVDLLKRIETEKDFLSGNWKFQSGVLVGSSPADGVAIGRVQVRYVPPVEEYNLTVVVERTEGADNIGFGLVAGAGRFMYHFDVDGGVYHGILAPDGAGGHRKASSTPGKLLQAGKQKTIVFMVRRAGLVVQVDGKDVCTTRQDWAKLAILSQCAPTDRDSFVVSSLKSSVRVSKMFVTFPSK